MPYYHIKDGGKIGLLSRRCSKCRKTWPITAWFQYPPPSDMSKFIIEGKGREKKEATYSKWADRLPMVNVIAKLLPNWPRWVRISSVCLFVLAIVLLIVFVTRGF